jgi:hypothetical protein
LESVKPVLAGIRALRIKQAFDELLGLCRRDPLWAFRVPRFVSLRNAVRHLDLPPGALADEALS